MGWRDIGDSLHKSTKSTFDMNTHLSVLVPQRGSIMSSNTLGVDVVPSGTVA